VSESYTKLMSSIVHSTVWSESLATKVVWITMLALSDRLGYVGASVPGLAKTAGVTLDECEEALRRLHAPDPHSRTKEFDGRRVETTERGWFILNYQAHRDRMDSESIRESKRNWWTRNRGKDSLEPTRRGSTQAAPAPAPKALKSKEKPIPPSEGEYIPKPGVKAWAEQKGYGPTFDLHLEHFRDYIAQPKNRKRYVNLDAAFRSCLRADWGGIRAQLDRSMRVGGGRPAGHPTQEKKCARGSACLSPGPLGGFTRMAIGDVCNPCREAYMAGKWK